MDKAGPGLEVRRKRIRFRAWHRGMREVDLILGRYADANVGLMDENGIAGFEALLDVPDPELLGWVTGEFQIPAERDSPMLRKVIAFYGGE